ncbi:MAG TPA: Ig-like domain-containing protein [Thermoanaerobaculia bacterium]|nr:Ig-like domain-containing protein [Thermoanaerobaculia bacterium]
MTYRALDRLLHLLLLSLLGALLGLTACGKANPVAPSGTTVTLSASPSKIVDASNGSTTITAVVRKPNGTPAAGVEVRFSTDIGNIDALATTNSNGVAVATLRGDGRFGTATVSATVDAAGATAVTLKVDIGAPAKSITLTANPPTLDAKGGTVTLVALVRDAQGKAVPGASVNFSSPIGTLDSSVRTTDATGQATDGLTVKSAEIANTTTFNVTAQAVAADGSLSSATASIQVLSAPAAKSMTLQASPQAIPSSGGTVTLIAVARDAQGQPLVGAGVNFTTALGRLSHNGAIQLTDSNGSVTETLTVSSSDITQTTPFSFTVTAQTPGTGGALLVQTVSITVNK